MDILPSENFLSQTKCNADSRRAGFTLIEMCVVIAIFAVLMAFAWPLMAEHMRNSSLRNAVNQISSDLYLARSQAIRTAANCSINYNNPVADQYSLTAPARTVDLSTYRGNVTFTGNPDGSLNVFSPTITYTARGLCSPPGQVYLTNQDGLIYRVQTSLSGGISVQMWNSASSSWN
jgi:prepilin-type N-terminal cleavage/methylation domain-containing protein